MGDFLGELEQMVLLGILRLGEGAFGKAIVEELERTVGRSVSRSTLYVTLDRLEGKGLVSTEMTDPTPERGGRRRRLFALEPAGVSAVAEARQQWQSLWEGVEERLEAG